MCNLQQTLKPDVATNLHKLPIKNYAKPIKKVAINLNGVLTFSKRKYINAPPVFEQKENY